MPKRNPHYGHVGLDFIDAFGLRNFSFQLCRNMENGRPEAVAIVHIVDGEILRMLFCQYLSDRQQEAVIRMAYTFKNRNTPVSFGSIREVARKEPSCNQDH